ncbi:MAG: ATP-grasp domain-containing protein [Eubacteriales bacterium]|nr:ATP-grasp domain-containing protein [Eubacteriales bacterium]
MNKKIAIVGAGDFQLPLVQEASKDNEVVLIAPVIDERFEPYIQERCLIDVRDQEAALAFCQEQKIDGIITDQTDISVRTVAYVAEKIGLPGIGYEKGLLFTDKSRMREEMMKAGIPCLPNRTVENMEDAVAFFKQHQNKPIIIKPLDSQGSRGIYSCHSEDEIREHYHESEKFSSTGEVIVEKLATGKEFFVEGMAYDGKFQNLIIGDTHYFNIENAYAAESRRTPSMESPELVQRVLQRNREIIEAFGLKQGISHSEFIVDDDEIYLLETAARGGGVYISSDLISLRTGINVEKFLVNIALGEQSGMPEIQESRKFCGYKAFYVPFGKVKKVSGVEAVENLPYVHRTQLMNLKEGMIVPVEKLNKTNRLALIVEASSQEEWLERVQFIENTLHVESEHDGVVRDLVWE